MVSGVWPMMTEALGVKVSVSSAQEIQERIDELLDRFTATKGGNRLALTLEYMTLKEALEDAETGRVIDNVTDARTAPN